MDIIHKITRDNILLEVWENEINEQVFMEKIDNAIACTQHS